MGSGGSAGRRLPLAAAGLLLAGSLIAAGIVVFGLSGEDADYVRGTVRVVARDKAGAVLYDGLL